MLLKIGELARRTGLSVRALHHYDAIGLLSPSRRTDGGARLYGREDLIRLHRIEALKQFACSLPDIQAALDSPDGPLETLRRQIEASPLRDGRGLARPLAGIGEVGDRGRRAQHAAAFMIDGDQDLVAADIFAHLGKKPRMRGEPFVIRRAGEEIGTEQHHTGGLEQG